MQLLELTEPDTRKVINEFPHVNEVLIESYKEIVLDNLLSSSPLFANIPKADRSIFIEKCKLKVFVSGMPIVNEGDPGDSMFMIKSGEVEVFKKDAPTGAQTLLAKLKPGEFFDEASMVSAKPRNATVKAVGFTEVLEFEKQTYQEIVQLDLKVKQIFEQVIRNIAPPS